MKNTFLFLAKIEQENFFQFCKCCQDDATLFIYRFKNFRLIPTWHCLPFSDPPPPGPPSRNVLSALQPLPLPPLIFLLFPHTHWGHRLSSNKHTINRLRLYTVGMYFVEGLIYICYFSWDFLISNKVENSRPYWIIFNIFLSSLTK